MLADYFKSHGDDAPSGENLEYDPDFMAMELVAQPEEERQAGDEIVEGKDPDYKALVDKAVAVLSRSHDIRAAVYVADSQIRLVGLEGFAEACKYIRFCLEDHWDTCHPELDEDDDDDPTMRINAVSNLAGRSTVLRGLRTWAPLAESRAFGWVTFKEVEIANGVVDPPEGEEFKSASDIDAAFMDTDPAALESRLTSAKDALEHVTAIDGIFLERTPGFGPNLEDLITLLNGIVKTLTKAVGGEEEAAEGEGGEAEGGIPAAGGAAGPGGGAAGGVPGQISSRADVVAALDRIIDYYTRYEPSSPLPIVLKRAKRLVGADFMTIINDLAPLGADNVKTVGGIVDE